MSKKIKKTVKQYKESINALESVLYERIAGTDIDNLPATFKTELDKIRELKPKSRSLKADYKRYERELSYALQWDISTEEGQRQLEKKENEAYKSFKDRFFDKDLGEDISYQEWRDLVETFGALGSATLEQFYTSGASGRGTGELVRVYKDAKAKGGAVDMLNAIRKVKAYSKTTEFKAKYGNTTTGMLDALRDELNAN